MPTVKGIYKIFCTETSHFYIGQSKSIYNRFHQHKKALNQNLHHNSLLQDLWNSYGESSFVFKVLAVQDNFNSEELKQTETSYIEKYVKEFGEIKRLNSLPHGTLVTESVYRNNRMFYVYNEFGEFINSFSSVHQLCNLLSLKEPSTIYKIVNEWKGYKVYKGFRIRKEYTQCLEPLENTFALFKNGVYQERFKTQQDLRKHFNIKGGGHLSHVLKGKKFKKYYQVVPYKKYIESTYTLPENYDVTKTPLIMLDARTKKPLKNFESFTEALGFLEYCYSAKDQIKLAIENDLTFLNYKWKYLND